MKKSIWMTLLLSGCVSSTDPNAFFSRVRSEPLGNNQYMVSCVDGPRFCARHANTLCPSGMDVVSNTTNPADYGRMTMVVKCN
jgi:hypothetical protein